MAVSHLDGKSSGRDYGALEQAKPAKGGLVSYIQVRALS